jgi:hypothetical protein
MAQKIRAYTACVLLGFFAVNFLGVGGWLDYVFAVYRPSIPQPALGFVYAVKTGGVHYVSAIEAAGFKLLFFSAWIAGFAMFLLMAVDFRRDPSGQFVRGTFAFESGISRLSYFVVFSLSLLIFTALIPFVGNDITQFTVIHGIVSS